MRDVRILGWPIIGWRKDAVGVLYRQHAVEYYKKLAVMLQELADAIRAWSKTGELK